MKVVAVLVAVLGLLVHSSMAYNTMCISANTHVKKLYVDGVDYIDRLPRRANPFQCDCFNVPPNATTIAVKAAASNHQLNKPGILVCETDKHAVYMPWKCAPSSKVSGRDWYMPGHPVGNKIWKAPVKSACQRSCRRKDRLPCKQSKCLWTIEHATSINCIMKKCADGCSGCVSAGPGKCDPGMCKYGESTNQLLGVTACNRVCKLEIKTWNITGPGFIKVTDTPTGRVSQNKLASPGAYLATVDMSMCTLTNSDYQTWANEATHSNLKQNWQSTSNQNLKNIVGIEVGVGFDPNPFSFAGYVAIYNLGIGTDNYLDGINDYYSYMSATLTGVNNGVVQLTDKVLVPYAG